MAFWIDNINISKKWKFSDSCSLLTILWHDTQSDDLSLRLWLDVEVSHWHILVLNIIFSHLVRIHLMMISNALRHVDVCPSKRILVQWIILIIRHAISTMAVWVEAIVFLLYRHWIKSVLKGR